MNDNARLLNFVYQNAQMGVDSIRQLMGIVENKELKEHLKENGTAMFEAGSEQLPFLASFAEELGEFSEQEILPDCFGRPRFLLLRKASQKEGGANGADSLTEERKKRTE